MLKEAHAMAGVFELVDVCPNFRLPAFFVGGGLATGGTAGMEGHGRALEADRCTPGQFDEDAADLLDFFVDPEKMLVAQQVSEAELAGLNLGFSAGMEWAILSPELLGGVARHPEGFFVGHRWFRPGGLGSRLAGRC